MFWIQDRPTENTWLLRKNCYKGFKHGLLLHHLKYFCEVITVSNASKQAQQGLGNGTIILNKYGGSFLFLVHLFNVKTKRFRLLS